MSSKAAATWLSDLSSFLSFSSSSSSSTSQHRYVRLQETADGDNMAPPPTMTSVDAAMEKRVVRKLDRRLIPLLFVTYMFNFMDKTILSSASVFGLQDDTKLHGQQYSWVSSIFYFGYLFWTYPTNLLIPRLPLSPYLTANTLLWGTVVALTAACTNYGGLLVVRFLLGAAEATITPAFMFLTTSFYTRDEIPVRTGLWFAGNSIGGLVASLFAFGVGHISAANPVGPWRWMYIILGLATFLWALVLWFFLPSSISRARFLTADEKHLAETRILLSGTASTAKDKAAAAAAHWNWSQTRECLVDPKTWFLVALELVTQIPNGGTQNFANLVLTGFGFTALQSTLLNLPYSLLAGAAIALTGFLSGRWRNATSFLVIATILPCLLGASLLFSRARIPRAAQLVGYFCLCTGSSAMPLALSLVQANFRGTTKRATVAALLFVAYCVGNVAGPQFFRASEAPVYGTAFGAILVCYALAIGLAVAMRVYLGAVNRRRAREDGFEGSAGDSGVVRGGRKVVSGGGGTGQEQEEIELRSEDYEDVTDWEIVGFRYRL